jgi:hypothetical protein
MIEANPTIAQSRANQVLRFRMRGAVITLAQQQAEKIIKQSIKDQGRKLGQFKRSEISQAARTYLSQHPELIEHARPIIEQWIAEGVFGKRAARALERNSQDTFSAEVRG